MFRTGTSTRDRNPTSAQDNGAAGTFSGLRAPDLWDELEAYGRKALARRLAEKAAGDIGLPSSSSRFLLREYLRFVYLTCITQEQLAPSKPVDALWHEHIGTGSHYFDEFGPVVVGAIRHHTPGRPHPSMDPAYRLTLDLYRREFGEAPPATFWPAPRAAAPADAPPPHWRDRLASAIQSVRDHAASLASALFGRRAVQTSTAVGWGIHANLTGPQQTPAPVPSVPLVPPLLTRLLTEARRDGPGTIRVLARESLDLGDEESIRLSNEYARFLYLLQSAPGPIVPPFMIHKLWSKHVLHTREYTGRFCPDVLGATVFPNHFASGPEPEAAAANTRAEYWRAFGGDPPSDIWPGPEEFAAIRHANRWSLGALGVIALCATLPVLVPQGWMVALAAAVFLLAIAFIATTMSSAYGAMMWPGKGKSRNGDSVGGGCG